MSHQVKAHTLLDTVVYWGAGGSILGFVIGVTPYLIFLSALITVLLGSYNLYIKAHSRWKQKRTTRFIHDMALSDEEILTRAEMIKTAANGNYKFTKKEKK